MDHEKLVVSNFTTTFDSNDTRVWNRKFSKFLYIGREQRMETDRKSERERERERESEREQRL
jgi:hypothetical protein